MGGLDGGEAASERVEHRVAGTGRATQQVDEERDGLLRGVAHALVLAVLQYVALQVVHLAPTLDRVQDQLVLALAALLGPRCAEAVGIAPDEGSAVHFPAGLCHQLAQLVEAVQVAEHVGVRLGLGQAEAFGRKPRHDLQPGLVAVVVEVGGC